MNNKVVHNVKWVQHPNFPDYYISKEGYVKLNKKIINLIIDPDRYYPYLTLRNTNPNRYLTCDIHRLVFKFFGEPKIKGYEIHHKDCNPLNNHIDNLVQVPKQEHYKIHKELRQLKKYQ